MKPKKKKPSKRFLKVSMAKAWDMLLAFEKKGVTLRWDCATGKAYKALCDAHSYLDRAVDE